MVRGLRNNNPGNLRHGSKWQGLAREQTDPAFCQFTEMRFGCRALIKVLQTYVIKYNLKTVRTIISRWAPPNENNTEAYIHSVASALGVNDNEELHFESYLYIRLAKAIARHENGIEADSAISAKTWQEAYFLI